jgi:site-specific DNA recombinase
MDEPDPDDPYYERKISDLQRRYDAQYGKIFTIHTHRLVFGKEIA